MIDNQAFIGEFVDEALAHLEAVEDSLLELDRGQRSDELINRIFRAVHSIKGTASFFGLIRIVELAHAMESLFGVLRSHELEYSDLMTDILLEANDCLTKMVENVYTSNECNIAKILLKLNLLAEPDVLVVHNGEASENVSRLTLVDENDREWILEGPERLFVLDSLKHGHHIFRITLDVKQARFSATLTPMQFMKKITSVGNIIQCFSASGQVSDLESALQEDAELAFLVTSVLERKLLTMALDIDEHQVGILRPLSTARRAETAAPHQVASLEQSDFALRDAMGENWKPLASSYWDENGLQPESPPLADQPEPPGIAVPESRQGPDSLFELESLSGLESEETSRWEAGVPALAEESIRVNVKTLNELLGLAGEMVLARNQLMRLTESRPAGSSGFDNILHRIDHLTTDLQEKILQTRMQPASNVFNKFPRVIRDLSRKTGKDIDLVIKGSETEMDKSIIEALVDPLTHIIRNAVDHGIELPALREASGKSRIGRVELNAYHEGGQVHVLVSDDGRGIHAEKIKDTAVNQGIIRHFEADQMSEAEALNLIFHPGFSTAEELSDISGRGVGMDVVRTNIEKIGGVIDIRTEVGTGTAFELTLPLTVAIVPALIVEAEGIRYALPRANIQEMVRINASEGLHRIELVYEAPVLRLRGNLLPLVHLGGMLSRSGDNTAGWSHIAAGLNEAGFIEYFAQEDRITRVLVVKAGARRFGLVVDRIFDGEEILVNPVPYYIRNCTSYAGVTIMGDGQPAMILDAVGLASRTNLRLYEESLSSLLEQSEQRNAAMYEKQSIMLFKGSGCETFGVDLSMVARVDEIDGSALEVIGDKTFIQYRGDIVRVIKPEDFLPVSRSDHAPARKYILIPKLVPRPMAIMFEKIYDTIETAVHFNDETIQAPGILGSAVLMNRIVLLLNLYDIFDLAEPPGGTPSQAGSDAPGIHPLAGYSVLLLEDTPFFARIEKEYLEAAGGRIYLAGNGEDALAILGSQKIDIIVSDINMPVMDGIQFIKRVRSNPVTAPIPALALTSLAGDKYVRAGLQAGFDDYEIKLDKNKLLAKLTILLEGRQAENAG